MRCTQCQRSITDTRWDLSAHTLEKLSHTELDGLVQQKVVLESGLYCSPECVVEHLAERDSTRLARDAESPYIRLDQEADGEKPQALLARVQARITADA